MTVLVEFIWVCDPRGHHVHVPDCFVYISALRGREGAVGVSVCVIVVARDDRTSRRKEFSIPLQLRGRLEGRRHNALLWSSSLVVAARRELRARRADSLLTARLTGVAVGGRASALDLDLVCSAPTRLDVALTRPLVGAELGARASTVTPSSLDAISL